MIDLENNNYIYLHKQMWPYYVVVFTYTNRKRKKLEYNAVIMLNRCKFIHSFH